MRLPREERRGSLLDRFAGSRERAEGTPNLHAHARTAVPCTHLNKRARDQATPGGDSEGLESSRDKAEKESTQDQAPARLAPMLRVTGVVVVGRGGQLRQWRVCICDLEVTALRRGLV